MEKSGDGGVYEFVTFETRNCLLPIYTPDDVIGMTWLTMLLFVSVICEKFAGL